MVVHENQRVFALATFLDWRDVIGWYGVTTKASVPLGQSHINSWDRVARSRAAAGSFAARDTRALTCNVYLDLSLSSLHLFPRLAAALVRFIVASPLAPFTGPCSYLSLQGALKIIIPVRLLKGPVSRSLNVYRVFRYSSTERLSSFIFVSFRADDFSPGIYVRIGGTRMRCSMILPWNKRVSMKYTRGYCFTFIAG